MVHFQGCAVWRLYHESLFLKSADAPPRLRQKLMERIAATVCSSRFTRLYTFGHSSAFLSGALERRPLPDAFGMPDQIEHLAVRVLPPEVLPEQLAEHPFKRHLFASGHKSYPNAVARR